MMTDQGRRLSRLTHSMIGCLLLAVASVISARGDSPTNLGEFRKKLEADWRHLRALDESCKSVDVTSTLDSKVRPDSSYLGGGTRIKIDWSKGFRSLEQTRSKESLAVVYARNPNYAFTAAKDEGAAGWRLGGYDKAEEAKNRIDQVITDGANRVPFYPLSTTCWLLTPLEQLPQDPNFHIEAVQTLSPERKQVRFSFKKFYPETKKWVDYAGFFYVDPRRSHVVEEWNFATLGPKEYRTVRKMEVDQDRNSALSCRKIILSDYWGSPGNEVSPQQVRTWTFANYDWRPFSTESFYLSHYGLPEPMDVPPPQKPTPVYVWLLASGLLCASAAFAARHFSRRLSAQTGQCASGEMLPQLKG